MADKKIIKIGERIKKYIEDMQEPNKKYTIKDFKEEVKAETESELDVTDKAIYKWITGEAVPKTENLVVLSKFFKITIDELLKGEIKSKGSYKNTTIQTKLANLSDVAENMLFKICKIGNGKTNFPIHFKVLHSEDEIIILDNVILSRDEVIKRYVIRRTEKFKKERALDFIRDNLICSNFNNISNEAIEKLSEEMRKYLDVGFVESDGKTSGIYYRTGMKETYPATEKNYNELLNLPIIDDNGNEVNLEHISLENGLDDTYKIRKWQSAWNVEVFNEALSNGNAIDNFVTYSRCKLLPYETELLQQSVDDQFKNIKERLFKELLDDEIITITDNYFSLFTQTEKTSYNSDYLSYCIQIRLNLSQEDICEILTLQYKNSLRSNWGEEYEQY